MRDNDIGDVLVVNKDGELCGIVTDRDIAMRVVGAGKSVASRLKGICTPEPLAINGNEALEEAIGLMREHAIRRLPVVDRDNRPVGIVTLGDAAIKLDKQPVLADISRAPAN